MFAWAHDCDLIAAPARFGRNFEKASAAAKRKSKSQHDLDHGKPLFTSEQIRLLLDNACITMRAMILMAINGGFGNNDLARLPIAAIDLNNAIIDFARPKTGVERRVPLWPETVVALRAALAVRPQPRNVEDRELAFLTAEGRPLVRENLHYTPDGTLAKAVPVNAVSVLFIKLLKRVEIKSAEATRNGLNFYSLRRTFRTIADDLCHDQHAIHRLMGHRIAGMAGIYVQRISDERLKAVTDTVREKIYASARRTSDAPAFGDDPVAMAAVRLHELLNE
jgi:integrase